ncbi:MAG: class I SAM-dependent methyltransferase [Halioglobus sp.]
MFSSDSRRDYLRCPQCLLVFVPVQYRLSRELEREEYDKHENAVDDPGYRQFLGRLFDPLVQRLPAGASGLDFGCGPGPALAHMLMESGFEVTLYDSFYHPDDSAMSGMYDFISATEVVEHLHKPGAELDRLWNILRQGGVLGVMTKLVIDEHAFAKWHYKNDPTHVCFFSRETWQWWARQHDADVAFEGSDVILLGKLR